MTGAAYAGPQDPVVITIDGSDRLQRFDGIGVNAHTASWDGDSLKPAIEALVYSMNATVWRVILETEQGWEDQNDNDDPSSFNWDFYNQVYETPKFRKAWEMVAFLNRLGIRDGVMINLMGRLPEWMGKNVVAPGLEEEYIEMIVSMLCYARFHRGLQFKLLGPMNEPDIRNEGPTMDSRQYARILDRLVQRLDEAGLGDLRIVGPDTANMGKLISDYLPAMVEKPAVMDRVAYIGAHSYGGYTHDLRSALKSSPYPALPFWMTEWNAWRDGLDDGQLGVYDYPYAAECVRHLLGLLKNGASAALVWEAYDSLYEHHNEYGRPPSKWSLWGILAYDQRTETYNPRKHFYAISQVSRFIPPGSEQVGLKYSAEGLTAVAFHDPASLKTVIVGENANADPLRLAVRIQGLPSPSRLQLTYTDQADNLKSGQPVALQSGRFDVSIPPKCIFSLVDPGSRTVSRRPQPEGWFAGDMHVHLSCGEDPIPIERLPEMMKIHHLNVVSLLADMGNGEVKDAARDLPRVNGRDDPISKPDCIIRWDAEWHWDATYTNFSNQALGGHLVILGAKEAQQIWDESPHNILQWARQQKAVAGFAHMQYLTGGIQSRLDCCIPVNYPVEAALGSIDFISEDVNGGGAALEAYYRLLNCGFRLGLAAGTDYPCNGREPLGSLLTYVEVKDQPFTYENWVKGISAGRTVISRVGGSEFLMLDVDESATPGDEIRRAEAGDVRVAVRWRVQSASDGRIELVQNGLVVSSLEGRSTPDTPLVLETSIPFKESGWLCARRMEGQEIRSHTAPIYVTVGEAPVRASAADARFFIDWIDQLLERTSPGGVWNHFFPTGLEAEQARFRQARTVYERIEQDSR